MKNKLLLILVIGCLLTTLCSCKMFTKNIVENIIKNNVENNITQNVVDYTGLENITKVEEAINVCIKDVENSVIGVTLKKVTQGTVSGTIVNFEDTLSIGSGVIYRRNEIKEGDKIKNYEYFCYTNAHVILTDENVQTHVYVYLGNDDLEVRAEILGYDEKLDIACLKFTTYLYFEPVVMGNSDDLQKGDFLVVVGNPDGYQYYGSATFGIVSNIGRILNFDTDGDNVNDYAGEFIQTDAAINPGNSGGGMFTLDGKFVGIPSIKLSSVKIDNMGFAIPVNIVKYACDNYLEKGLEIVRPRLGITCVAVKDFSSTFMIEHGIASLPNIYGDSSPYGIYIQEFSKIGSMVNAGLSKGDILLTMDGDKLYDNSDISGRLNNIIDYHIGKVVTFTYYSAKEQTIKSIEITLVKGE